MADIKLCELYIPSVPTKFDAHCHKCADLAIVLSGNGSQVEAANALIVTNTENIYFVCNGDDLQARFARLLGNSGVGM